MQDVRPESPPTVAPGAPRSRPRGSRGSRLKRDKGPKSRKPGRVGSAPGVPVGTGRSEPEQLVISHVVEDGLVQYGIHELGVKLVAGSRTAGWNPHVTLAAQRLVGRYRMAKFIEADMVRNLNGTNPDLVWGKFSSDTKWRYVPSVMVIGGEASEVSRWFFNGFCDRRELIRLGFRDSVNRFCQAVVTVHGCTPKLESADLMRPSGDCRLKALDCMKTCFLSQPANLRAGELWMWFSSHSLYYLSQQEILELTVQCRLRIGYALLHTFDTPKGSFIGYNGVVEARWWTRDDGRLQMAVAGSSTDYVHDSMKWIRDSSRYTGAVDLGSGMIRSFTLCWARVAKIGDMAIWKFVVTTDAVGESPPHSSLEVGMAAKDDAMRQAEDAALGVIKSATVAQDLTQATVAFTASKAARAMQSAVPNAQLGDAVERVMSRWLAHMKESPMLDALLEHSATLRRVGATYDAVFRKWSWTVSGASSLAVMVRCLTTFVTTLWPTWAGRIALLVCVAAVFVKLQSVAFSLLLWWLAVFMYTLFSGWAQSVPFSRAHPVPAVGTGATTAPGPTEAPAAGGLVISPVDPGGAIPPGLWLWNRYTFMWMPPWVALIGEIAINWCPFGCCVNVLGEILIGDYTVAWIHLIPGVIGTIFHGLWNMTAMTPRIRMYDVCCEGRDLKPQRTGAVLTPRALGECKPRVVLSCELFYVRYRFPVVARQCVHNERIALANRVLMRVPEATAQLWPIAVHEMLRRAPPFTCVTVPWLEWQHRFPGWKKRRMAEYEFVGPGQDDSKEVRAFVKRELLVKGSGLRAVDGVVHPEAAGDVEQFDPRLISARSDVYQTRMGPYCLGVSESMKSAYWYRHVTYACGMNAVALGHWYELVRSEGQYWWYVGDFSRFDGHVGPDALRAQAMLMAHFTSTPSNSPKELRDDLVTIGATKYWKYKVGATRKSGNADTTCGNSLLNIAVWTMIVCDQRVSSWRLIVMGDDAVMASSDRLDLRRVHSTAERLGFSLDVLEVPSTNVKFCSSRPFRLPGGGFRFATLPGRYLSKAGWAMDLPPYGRSRAKWCIARARAMVIEYAHVPVMRAIALLVGRVVLGIKDYPDFRHVVGDLGYETDAPHLARIKGLKPYLVGDSQVSMDWFCRIYDLMPAQVTDCEEWILSRPGLPPYDLVHPVLERLVELDV